MDSTTRKKSHPRKPKLTKALPDGVPSFSSTGHFPLGTLPTKEDVIKRMLYEDHFETTAAAKKIAVELIDVWTTSNVYTVSELSVKDKIHKTMIKFCEVCKYDKKKIKNKACPCGVHCVFCTQNQSRCVTEMACISIRRQLSMKIPMKNSLPASRRRYYYSKNACRRNQWQLLAQGLTLLSPRCI